MTWRVPPFDQAIAELEAHVRATWQPLGIVIAGSIVRGEAGPTSDLDLYVVHDQPWRLRAQRRFAGVPAELFVSPPAQIRRYFASEHADGQPSTAHMFATGELLGPPPGDRRAGPRSARLACAATLVHAGPTRRAALRRGRRARRRPRCDRHRSSSGAATARVGGCPALPLSWVLGGS